MPHPLVAQLRFARSEFKRGLAGVTDEEARRRFGPMNCISWNVGHLAWQEQRYFLDFATGKVLSPAVREQFAYGAPASTPALGEILSAWETMTSAADGWLETVGSADLVRPVVRIGRTLSVTYGSLLLRTIYHYWYHLGENQAIRQMLGHTGLPEYVGNIDDEAPYRPESG
jgi:hypothetical protein